MSLYAAALIAQSKENIFVKATAINAENEMEASVLALELCLFHFPTAQGHFDHGTALHEIPLEMIESGLA